MPGLLPKVDPDGLLEYSVVYTDRSVNHMSQRFQQAMRDIHNTLAEVYHAHRVVIVPGSGTFGMESVARQFAEGKRCLVIRNGWFSYRWSQILEAGQLASAETVMSAQMVSNSGAESGQAASIRSDASLSPYAPMPIDKVVASIEAEKPDVVFAPHVETSAGMILPDDYLSSIAAAVHAYGGLFVLDCIASGTAWVDMQATGVDVIVSAPQKGWSGSPCAGLLMLSERAHALLQQTTNSSYAMDLKKWSEIMEAYVAGKHAYHATMPTDALLVFRDVMNEIRQAGFDELKARQAELGSRVRALLDEAGFVSVAASGFQAPGVAVYYTDQDSLHNGSAFVESGVQIAAGVPLQIGEPAEFKTFRIGLFGIDKLRDVDAAVNKFRTALDAVLAKLPASEPEPAEA